MPLAWGKLYPGILADTSVRINCFAVKENILACWRTIMRSIDNELVRSPVVVVGQDERAEIDIIIQTCRPVNMDGSNNAISILGREVRMIPAGSILMGNIGIDSFTSWWNWTLGDAIDSILELMNQDATVSIWVNIGY